MGSSTITEVLDFTGGMNTLLAPHLIGKNEAVSLINVDIRLGSLSSMPNLDYVQSLPNGPFFYQYNRIVYSYPSFRNNVLWDDKWYWSDGINTGKVLDDGTELPLGLPTPTTALTQALVGAIGSGVHEGDFKYTYTFWSADTGAESAPAPLPLYISADGQNITLTGFEALPAEATHYRLYRIGGYLPSFTLVERFTNVSYTDALDDTKIDGRQLLTMRNGVPPAGLTNLVELNGRFYGSVDNRVYFSALGNPDSWYVSDFIDVKGRIIGLASAPAGLLVLGQFSTSLIYGTGPSDFRLKLISDQYGCLGAESISYIGDSVVWLSNKQIVMSNGYKIMDITAFKIDRIKGLIPTGAVVENETYYMSFQPGLFPTEELYPADDLYPDNVEGTSILDQGIMALDFKRGKDYSYKMIGYDDVRSLGLIDANIHVGTGSYAGNEIVCDGVMYEDCLSFTNCSPFEVNIMNVYQDQGLARLSYVSPKFIDSGLAILKQYDKVRILSIGTFNVKIFFGDTLLLERDIVNTVDDPYTMIGIPNKQNTSYSIRFVIEGVGSVNSIQYSWKNREEIN
jgi:hypothetical protein